MENLFGALLCKRNVHRRLWILEVGRTRGLPLYQERRGEVSIKGERSQWSSSVLSDTPTCSHLSGN